MSLRDGLRTVTSSGRPAWLGNAAFIGACAVAAAVGSVVFGATGSRQSTAPHHANSIKQKVRVVAAAMAPSQPTPPEAVQPSFDCLKVRSAVPQLICSNPFLAALDQELADAYRTALGASRQPEVLRASQVAWVAMRNAAPPEAMGIAGWYANRIDVLKHVNDPGPQPLSGADPSPSAELGSGFFVTAEGRFITNAHVVRGCYEIGIRQHDGTVGRGRVIANDDADDLALGQIDAVGQYPAISIRSDPPKLGEDILVFGFPLPGVLASSGNLTLGNITALSGLGDNTSMEQVSAPVQPGNSGGPVMDKAGNLVGVVVAKLDSEKLASITHGIPQNVNFAIKPAVLTNFLAAHSVAYTSAASDSEPLGTSAVAALSENVTVQVYCKPQ